MQPWEQPGLPLNQYMRKKRGKSDITCKSLDFRGQKGGNGSGSGGAQKTKPHIRGAEFDTYVIRRVYCFASGAVSGGVPPVCTGFSVSAGFCDLFNFF
jgi:hypothetical protein